MNITFLIGNGFDLNLGLDTRFSDFIKFYTKKTNSNSDTINYFKQLMDQENELWSSAEEAFGKISNNFVEDGKNAEEFSVCHEDFCEKLAQYLSNQVQRIDFNSNKPKIANAFSNGVQNFMSAFREVERNAIANDIKRVDGGYVFNFINFNYTNTLNNCINAMKSSKTSLGTRVVNGHQFGNVCGTCINVHGTTERDMVLGVHDKSQISNSALFEGYGDEYIGQIIKSQTDNFNQNNTYNMFRCN